jgi:hypothetical protein
MPFLYSLFRIKPAASLPTDAGQIFLIVMNVWLWAITHHDFCAAAVKSGFRLVIYFMKPLFNLSRRLTAHQFF